jgi:ribosomal protein S20
MAKDAISYDKSELRAIVKSFKAMDEEATEQAKEVTSELAEYVRQKVIATSSQRNNRASKIIAEGASVRKSSKIGEISYGFARQKLTGGGTTQQVWGGYEFGSRKYKQFPTWSGKRGWFIYPTLKGVQPDIVKKWEQAFGKIVGKYT